MLGPAVIIRGMSAVRMKRERGRRLLQQLRGTYILSFQKQKTSQLLRLPARPAGNRQLTHSSWEVAAGLASPLPALHQPAVTCPPEKTQNTHINVGCRPLNVSADSKTSLPHTLHAYASHIYSYMYKHMNLHASNVATNMGGYDRRETSMTCNKSTELPSPL